MFTLKQYRGAGLVLACGLAGLMAGCGSINWERDQQAGLQKAVQNRQRALIEFTSVLDEGARQMDDEVFSDPDVQKLMQRYVPIRLDAGANKQLVEQFGVQKTPAFVVVRPDLTVAGTCQGTMKADQFRLFLIKSSLN